MHDSKRLAELATRTLERNPPTVATTATAVLAVAIGAAAAGRSQGRRSSLRLVTATVVAALVGMLLGRRAQRWTWPDSRVLDELLDAEHVLVG
jgi:uncharacterized membrane protein YfcA